jgi:glucan 1,3-beta-glucosidase
MVGEFSVATNDCAQYVNGIDGKPRWQGDCTYENDVSTFSPEYKTFLTNFFNAQLDAFEQGIGWFYWNFKTETNPVWSYVDGVKHGWIPKDVNDRGPGFCAPNGYNVRV